MSQPKWKFVGNVHEGDPLVNGACFVYVDETGVYEAEAEIVLIQTLKLSEVKSTIRYQCHRCILERCTYINGVLSDNPFHPDHPAWFAQPETQRLTRPQDTTYLSNVSSEPDQLIEMLCSEDPLVRARAYYMIGRYHGFENLDSEPMVLRRWEFQRRFKIRNGILYKRGKS